MKKARTILLYILGSILFTWIWCTVLEECATAQQRVEACMACCGHGNAEHAFTDWCGTLGDFAPWADDSIWRHPDGFTISHKYAVLDTTGCLRWGWAERGDTAYLAPWVWMPSDSNRVYVPPTITISMDAPQVPRYAPPDSLIPWCYMGFDGPALLHYGVDADTLQLWGIRITTDDCTPDQHLQMRDVPRAFADDTIEPFPEGWPSEFGRRGWRPPEGMPGLYYELVDSVLSGAFGWLSEAVADGAWHYTSEHLPSAITWDCCPDSLWPHPAGCVREFGYWYQTADGGWEHWRWQIRWNTAIRGYWEIVGGLPGGGWWSPHLGPWVQRHLENQE